MDKERPAEDRGKIDWKGVGEQILGWIMLALLFLAMAYAAGAGAAIPGYGGATPF